MEGILTEFLPTKITVTGTYQHISIGLREAITEKIRVNLKCCVINLAIVAIVELNMT